MNNNEIDQILNISSDNDSPGSSTQILSSQERESLMSPQKPWYAKTWIQVFLVLFVVSSGALILNSFFISRGTPQAVAKDNATQREQELALALKDQNKKTEDAKEEAWRANQPKGTTIKVLNNPNKTNKPIPPTPRNVVRPPQVVYRDRNISAKPIPFRTPPAPPAKYYAPPAPRIIPSPTPSIPIASQPHEDPATAAQRLSALGVVVDGGSSSQSAQIASSPSGDYTAQNTSYVPSNIPQIGQADYPSGISDGASSSSGQPVAINPSGAFKVAKRSSASAKLLDEVRWTQNPSELQGQTFEAKLTSDFGNIPKGSILKLQASPAATTQGSISLIATSVSIGQSDYPLPDAFKIKATVKLHRPNKGFGLGNIIVGILGGAATSGLSEVTSGSGGFAGNAINNAGNAIVNGLSSTSSQTSVQRQQYFELSQSIEIQATQDSQF